MQNVLIEQQAPCAARRGDLAAAPSRPVRAPAEARAISPAQIRAALAHLLASQEFCKAQRMSRLIRFLIEKELAGEVRDTAEYAIGIEVFDRDALSYSTCEDPTVRVQVGRLRDRLKAYYAASGARAELRFSIPIGSYMPLISRPGDSAFPQNQLLAIMPLLNAARGEDCGAFLQGLNEELSHQLFKVFGHKIVPYTFAIPDPASAQRQAASHGISQLLEGSIRNDGDLLRISLRLIDAGAGCIAWSEQFDRRATLDIGLQEELALAICGALKLYFEQG